MAIVTISHNASLDVVWAELIYTETRLLMHKEAKDLAPEHTAALVRWAKVAAGQRECWRGEILAQILIDIEDEGIDDFTEALSDALLALLGKDRKSARYKRYFKKAPNLVIRMGLESQLAVLKPWKDSLLGEPEKELKDLGTRLGKLLTSGQAAIDKRAAAIAATADHRIREIIRLIDDVNAMRQSTYGILTQRAAEKRLGRDWANRFFRRSQSSNGKKGTKKGGGGGDDPPK